MATDKKISIILDRPRRLWLRHKDIRDAVNNSGKTIVSLLDDMFGGWPYLLQAALRHEDTRLTLDDCSEMIDRWVDGGKPVKELQDKLIEALEVTGFIKIQRPEEANPQTPATT